MYFTYLQSEKLCGVSLMCLKIQKYFSKPLKKSSQTQANGTWCHPWKWCILCSSGPCCM